ncbi:MAG TPA: hypothetical protein VF933_37780 [Streptosporangiaceae bacterium]
MRYQQDLQGALRERYRRLLDADYATSGHEIQLVVAWIGDQAPLRGILSEAERAEPDLDFDTWEKSLAVSQVFSWRSRTEEGRATLAWKLMQHIATADRDTARINNLVFNYATRVAPSPDGENRAFVQIVFGPLFDFLVERVGAESSVLYVLERYVRRVEWFDRDRLYKRFDEDTRNGEETYNLDLQRFLFLDGNYVTHAKVRSASGEPDLVGDLGTDDPLVCDGKIFDGHGRGKNYLAKGVNQIVQYAGDHNEHVAYLVIFNITGRPLQLPSDGPGKVWPPHIEMSGIRVYLIAIRALPPDATASKQGKPKPITVTRNDLGSR